MEISQENLKAMTTADISSTLMLLNMYPSVFEKQVVIDGTPYHGSVLIRKKLADELHIRLNKVFIF